MTEDGSYWGAPRWLEVTVVQAPLPRIVEPLLSQAPMSAARCRACGRPSWHTLCVFCQLPCTDVTADLDRSMAADGVGL
jgi:hypothetical protein